MAPVAEDNGFIFSLTEHSNKNLDDNPFPSCFLTNKLFFYNVLIYKIEIINITCNQSQNFLL